MTSQPAPAPSEPERLLAATRDLARRVRDEQRGAWLPLLVFAVVTFGAIPVDRFSHRHPTHCTTLPGGNYVCATYPTLTLWYWPVATVLGYGLISWFYLARSRRHGVGTRSQPYVIVGIVLLALVLAWAFWAQAHPAFLAETLHVAAGSQPSSALYRIASPAGAIGLALLLLARIERSWVLFAVTVVYLVVVTTVEVGPFTHPSPWTFLPHVLADGGVLLFGGVALLLLQHRHNPSSG